MAELEPERLELCQWNFGGEDKQIEFVNGDLRETWRIVVEQYSDIARGDPVLLTACPPCQGMSTARSGLGSGSDLDDGEHDERNLLVEVIAEVALSLMPKIIVVENVPAFLTRRVPHPNSGDPISAARLLCDRLDGKYVPFPIVVDLADYGVPQTRRRTFITYILEEHPATLALHNSNRSPYPKPDESQIKLGDFLRKKEFPERDAKDGPFDDNMDQTPRWSDRQYRMVSAIPPYSGSSAWTNHCDNEACSDISIDEDAAVCPGCGEVLPRPVVEKEGKAPRLVKGFRRSSYRRMYPDRPAPTVTTASNRVGSDYNIHPWENRVLTPRECAALQTFPEDFVWEDPKTGEHAIEKWGSNEVRAVIGEAVPAHFTGRHGQVLKAILDDTWKAEDLIASQDECCVRATEKLGVV
jgi:DNA (cytosine-5)-methyltransferase 1